MKRCANNGRKNYSLDPKGEAPARGRLKHIAKDSILQADKVFDQITASTSKLPEHPERYPRDKYKVGNKGNYRAYEIYRYRISYRITKKTIYIVRVRNTKQAPLDY